MPGSRLRIIGATALALLAALAGTSVPAQTRADATVARPVTQALPYVNLPRISGLRVSPSNTHAAFLWMGNEGRLVLAVVDLAEPTNLRVLAGNKDLDVRNIHWVNDRRLVFNTVPPELTVIEAIP